MIVIGIDPDSDRHGIAVYRDGKLAELHMMNLIELRLWIDAEDGDMLFSIENVLAKNGLYARNSNSNPLIAQNIALKLGRCQQAQEELMREIDHRGLPYILHKPNKANWANDNRMFQRVTKWTGRSNSDTRSAAYWGWLAVQSKMGEA